MELEAKKYLHDIHAASTRIVQFTAGRTFEEYESDAMLRSAVERQFEIVGEALTRLAKLDQSLVSRIAHHRRIIAFRNILVHAYAQIDNRLVWGVVKSDVDRLVAEVEELLRSAAD